MSPRAARLFHLVRPADWRAQRDAQGAYAPPSLASAGFVHLSFAHQLEGSLRTHFADARELWLVELDGRRVEASLALEPSRGGALFPHLRRAVAPADCVRWWPLQPPALPALGASESADRPRAREGAPA